MRSVDEHLQSPSLGAPPAAALRGDVATETSLADGCAGGSCGVLTHYWLDVGPDHVIRACTARVRGRASAFATASALCEAAVGRSVVDAARLGLTTMHPSFAAFDEEDEERALVAEDGFHHALGRWLLDRMRAAPAGTGAERPVVPVATPGADRPIAVVGMSGGVDSAVALHRMADEHAGAVAGATLRLWIDPRAPDPDSACCSPDSVRRARATCHAAGLPHLSIDLRDAFAREVVVPFVTDYADGRTPNPCVGCNGHFRLDELVRLADVLGAAEVATGHYARVLPGSDGAPLIARGVDPTKDQSYMLAEVASATTARLRFPLGAQHKTEIRAEAAARGLEQASIPGSQEICFLGGGDYRAFLGRAGAMGAPGEIVRRADDGTEQVVGAHDGIARFTPGQRKGIGIAAEHPLYVLDVDPEGGRVVVGTDDGLRQVRVAIGELRWHDPSPPREVHVQLRYRSRSGASPARVLDVADVPAVAGVAGVDAVLELADGVRAPAPGQAAVLYDSRDAVLGTGRIVRVPALAGARPTG